MINHRAAGAWPGPPPPTKESRTMAVTGITTGFLGGNLFDAWIVNR